MFRLAKKNTLNLKNNFFRKNGISTLEKNDFLVISDEIKYSERPVVALESTIITHGLPYPINLQTAFEVENVVREQNAIPATIGFINGKLKVGLNKHEIETLAREHKNAIKISRRDLSFVLSSSDKNLVGGTTVSTTIIAAHAANIRIFATGGIGGVHRDFNDSMDVSADLLELARMPIAVVSSGIKSILDISKTLEYLETIGVAAYTFNKSGSKEFPCFFTSKSGLYAPYNMKSEQEAAQIINTNFKTGLNSGLLIGVPIPDEHSIDANLIETAIQEALMEAKKLDIKGKKITPFLLEKINQLTKGSSLNSNLALIKNNAKISARIAIELKKIQASPITSNKSSSINLSNKKQITVIGGLNLDTYNKLKDETTLKIKGVTQPSEFYQVLGGVGFNMANALIRLKQNSTFITALSNDIAGKFIRDESTKIGFDTSIWLFLNDKTISTGSYSAIFDTSGELIIGCGDMRAHSYVTPELIENNIQILNKSDLVAIDADIPKETISYICNFCSLNNIPIWYNPTDIRKCTKIVETNNLSKVTYLSPNLKELITLFQSTFLLHHFNDANKKELKRIAQNNNLNENLDLNDLKEILKYLLDFVPFIILSRGSKDLIFASKYDLDLNATNQLPIRSTSLIQNRKEKKCFFNFPVVKLNENERFVNVSGAGDSCSGGIMSGIINNYTFITTIYNGLICAKQALMTRENVSPELDKIELNYLKQVAESNQTSIKKVYLID